MTHAPRARDSNAHALGYGARPPRLRPIRESVPGPPGTSPADLDTSQTLRRHFAWNKHRTCWHRICFAVPANLVSADSNGSVPQRGCRRPGSTSDNLEEYAMCAVDRGFRRSLAVRCDDDLRFPRLGSGAVRTRPGARRGRRIWWARCWASVHVDLLLLAQAVGSLDCLCTGCRIW
jgi:hypothetical protein